MTSTSKQPVPRPPVWGPLFKRGLAAAAFMLGVAILVTAVVWWRAHRVPEDAPLARMYRTEADLWMLRHAIEQYHEKNGVYPPSGREGLEKAIETFGQGADYLPGGPPPDAWGRPFHYAPHTAYGEDGVEVFQTEKRYEAPETFQLFSPGASGEPGFDDAEARRDTITSWEPDRPWRGAYRRLNEAFMEERREPE